MRGGMLVGRSHDRHGRHVVGLQQLGGCFLAPFARPPGYTFVETGVPGALYTAISPLQGDDDLVTFFVGVDDLATTISETTRLGGRVVQEPVTVPGVQFALIADPQGHVVGLAQQL